MESLLDLLGLTCNCFENDEMATLFQHLVDTDHDVLSILLVQVAEAPADDYAVHLEFAPMKFLHSYQMFLDALIAFIQHHFRLLHHINVDEAPLQKFIIPAVPAHKLKNAIFFAMIAVQGMSNEVAQVLLLDVVEGL